MEVKTRISVFSFTEKNRRTGKELKKSIVSGKKKSLIIKFIISWLESLTKICFLILKNGLLPSKVTTKNFFSLFLKSVCKIFVELSNSSRFYFELELNSVRLQKILFKAFDILDKFLKTENKHNSYKSNISIKKKHKNLHENLWKRNYHGLIFDKKKKKFK